MYTIEITNAFKKDLKKAQKRQLNIKLLKYVIQTLEQGKDLEPKYCDHKLTGNWADFRECHIKPDWLLIYRIADNTLTLVRTGSHSDLFKK